MNEPQKIVFLPTDWELNISVMISAASTFLVVVYALYAKITKDVLGKMVLALNASDLLFTLVMLSVHVYKPDSDIYCKVIQAFAHCSLLLSLMWGTFFGHGFYSIVKYRTMSSLENAFKYYVIVSLTVSVSVGFGTILTEYSTYDGAMAQCVHTVGSPDITLIAFSQIPIFTLTILGLIWYVYAAVMLRREESDVKIKHPLTLLVYPGIVILCWLPVNIVTTAAGFGYTPSKFIDFTTKNLFQLQGFFDALVYGITPLMKRARAHKRSETVAPEEELRHSSQSVVVANSITPIHTDGEEEYDFNRPNSLEP